MNYQDILLEWNSTGGVLLPNIGLVWHVDIDSDLVRRRDLFIKKPVGGSNCNKMK